jgi:hypothetical protein
VILIDDENRVLNGCEVSGHGCVATAGARGQERKQPGDKEKNERRSSAMRRCPTHRRIKFFRETKLDDLHAISRGTD